MVWCVFGASILAALYSMEVVRRLNYSYARLNRTIRYSRWLKSYRQQIDMHKSIAATLVMNIDDLKKESLAWQGACASLRKCHGRLYDENQVLIKRNQFLEARTKAIEHYAMYTNTVSPPATYELITKIAKRMSVNEKICTNRACAHDVVNHGDNGCLIKGCGCLITYPKQGGSHASSDQKEERVDSNQR